MEEIKIKITQTPDEISEAQQVRKSVFQKEQGIAEELDFDGKDQESEHVIVYLNNEPIATTRIRYLDKKVAKIERTSVLPQARGKDIGKKLMEHALDYLKKKGIKSAVLNAQEQAKGFYEKLGFAQEGDKYEEVGISHVKMHKKL